MPIPSVVLFQRWTHVRPPAGAPALNNLERRIMAVICVISANSVALGAHCLKVVEDIKKRRPT